ncbi:MAG: penicillin-binding protein [Acidobacteriota bacterium]|nr:penicillin-binding protein [Acidobacteriota bacterium]
MNVIPSASEGSGRAVRGKRKFARPLAAGFLATLGMTVVWLLYGPLPPIRPADITSATIVDRNGVVLYEPLSPKETRGEWLDAKDIPRRVEQATLAVEDRHFYHHPGIDPMAVARALLHNVRSMRVIEGGSTLTQQVAKMLLGRGNRSFVTKMRETAIALRLERRYSKREILALYLNLAPYAPQTNGIVRASRRWFGCTPEDLTIAQAAYLAALPRRPNTPDATRRQQLVLRRMLDEKFISADEYKVALAERLRFDRGVQPLIAAHFVERVRERTPAATRIETTLDATLQREVQGIIAAQRATLLRHGAHSVAVAVLDNRSGEWLAWEGSGDYFGADFGGAIDGVTSLRQPGSALKPFTYALAFEQGFTPATVLNDVPTSFPTAEEGIVYTPRNYDGRYRGPLRARLALAGSENVPAVAMLAKLGPPSLLRMLRRSGFRSLDRTADYYGLGLTLGDAEVTLEQLVSAYAVFARGGIGVTPTMLRRTPRTESPRIVSERTAFWISDILGDDDARAYAFGSGGSLEFPFAVAVKTGTSQAYRDNWTVGYTRDVTVGVWVGNFDRTPLRNSSGVTGAGPIFHSVMLAAMKGRTAAETIVAPPANVERVEICALTGLRPSISCPSIATEWLPSEAPAVFCDERHSIAAPSFVFAKTTRLSITSPANGATYLIDPTLRMEFQALPLRASDPRATFHIDGKRIASRSWPLRPGKHVITARNERGARDEVAIQVK